MTLDINNITKTFGSFTAVNDVSFKVNDGTIFGFLGTNGAGKTTTMAAKVKYLVEKRNVNPDEIVVISYTNMAI